VGTVTWRIKTLKRKTDAPNHVGSGDWLGRIISQLDFFCSKSANRFRNSRTSRCKLDVAAATKKKHIGKKHRNEIAHELGLRFISPRSEMYERNAQNANGVQCGIV
jgi:hypothetical protein